VSTTGHEIDGLLLHGPIAGALAVEKIHALVGRGLASLTPLVKALASKTDWRMIICELPDDSEHSIPSAALVAASFACEGSVAAFFDDETALGLWILRRGAGSG
jgi:hypothetical protein